MVDENLKSLTIGWVGTGKMGFPMAARLIEAGIDVTVYNRTASKAEPLGVSLVEKPADLADRDIVYTIVTDDKALLETTIGPNGILSSKTKPKILIDSSTVSLEASEKIRGKANEQSVMFLAAPISGNGNAVKAGQATLGVSGPRAGYDIVEPFKDLYINNSNISFFCSVSESKLKGGNTLLYFSFSIDIKLCKPEIKLYLSKAFLIRQSLSLKVCFFLL